MIYHANEKKIYYIDIVQSFGFEQNNYLIILSTEG